MSWLHKEKRNQELVGQCMKQGLGLELAIQWEPVARKTDRRGPKSKYYDHTIALTWTWKYVPIAMRISSAICRFSGDASPARYNAHATWGRKGAHPNKFVWMLKFVSVCLNKLCMWMSRRGLETLWIVTTQLQTEARRNSVEDCQWTTRRDSRTVMSSGCSRGGVCLNPPSAGSMIRKLPC